MKITLIILFLISKTLVTFSQTFQFEYDAAGNRINRHPVPAKQSQQNPEEQKAGNITIKVFPNPTMDFIKVEIEGLPKDSKVKVEMIDLQGVRFYNDESNNTLYNLDLSRKSAGVYLLNIFIDGKPTYWKIIKE
ncbi:MAG: hypothetical protein HW421_1625 [Ignavibacteria bacterium]|nr:hypothetical protein [Ignavibacteria bacterium]